MPGTYTLDIPIGYYTHVAGLGKTSADVIINGGPNVHNSSENANVGALNNFWRTCENMTVNPKDKNGKNIMVYAVSQASSLRSVIINGDLHLGDMTEDNRQMGFASGGFMSNCTIKGQLNMGSQQQFICRNTEYLTFPTALWNQVLVGCKSGDEGRTPYNNCINTKDVPFSAEDKIKISNVTVEETTPTVAEKPYLAITNGKPKIDSIVVMIPLPKKSTKGINNDIPPTQINSTNYQIVTAITTVSEINSILAKTEIKCIIFSPGRYNIDSSINLNGKILFGLGLPVLKSTNNNNIIKGYGMICGIIFEAGPLGDGMINNNILVNLEAGNPSYLWDIVCRVGGGDKNSDIYSVDKMLHVGGDGSILDNIWCWVADHYATNEYTLWDKAICNIGVHVTGNNVIAYGLFSEHNRKRNVMWEGNSGEVYMFQSEFNYFPPDQNTFNDSVSYEVADGVTSHKIRGAGAYSFFPNTTVSRQDTRTPPDTQIFATSGFKFNKSTTDYKTIVTVFLNGFGGITNIINNEGVAVKYDASKVSKEGIPLTQIGVICNNDGSDDLFPDPADQDLCKIDYNKDCPVNYWRCKYNDKRSGCWPDNQKNSADVDCSTSGSCKIWTPSY